MKTKLWFWLIPLSLLWPVLHIVVFLIRFSKLPSDGLSLSLTFLPMGLISGVIFLLLWVCTAKKVQKIGLILGYLLASPIAFMGSLLSGLVYQPILGSLLWGASPLVLGILIGALVGYLLAK